MCNSMTRFCAINYFLLLNNKNNQSKFIIYNHLPKKRLREKEREIILQKHSDRRKNQRPIVSPSATYEYHLQTLSRAQMCLSKQGRTIPVLLLFWSLPLYGTVGTYLLLCLVCRFWKWASESLLGVEREIPTASKLHQFTRLFIETITTRFFLKKNKFLKRKIKPE